MIGSIINHVMSRQTNGEPEPTVGMGATVLMYSDRHAATVTRVERVAGTIVIDVRHDVAKVVKGSTFDGSAEYEYTPDPEGWLNTFRKNQKTGRWDSVWFNRETGRYNKNGTGGLAIGRREEYRDPHF